MAVTVTNDSKNTITITNDTKSGNPTWDEYYDTWAEAEGTWDRPNTPMQSKPAKNNVSITNDTKS